MKTASVTELKNQLSARLKEVAAGQPLLVTDRDKPVAILQPLSGAFQSDRLPGLIASGLVRPARTRLDVDAFLNERRGGIGANLSEAVLEDREGR